MAYMNPLIAKWKAGKPTFGGLADDADVSIAEYFALSGYDEVTADQQHSTIETNDLGIFCGDRVARRRPATRVPFNDTSRSGARWTWAPMVIIPMVNNAAEAARRRRHSATRRVAIGPPGPSARST